MKRSPESSCGRRTLRCDEDPGSPHYRYSSYGADTPLCCASHLVETTFALTALLEARDIPYFILWGTHLGAVRHGGLIPWDTDVDLGVLAEDLPRVSQLAEPLAVQGFRLRDTPEKGCLTLDYSAQNQLHMDIYPWRREGTSFVCQEYTIAEDQMLPLRRYPFHGRSLLGPRGLDYLFAYYGGDCLERGRKQWLGWGTRLWKPGQSAPFELGDRSPAAIDLGRDYEAESAPPGLLHRAEALLRHRAGLWKLRAYWAALGRDGARSSWVPHPTEDPRLKEWYRSDALTARLTRDAYRAAKRHYQEIRAIPWQRTFRHNLQLLHDVLATTPMADRYWVIGGLLLGWAREGRPIVHDRDADFGIRGTDRETFFAAVPRLVAAGFLPIYRWTNNAGAVTEYCFVKDDVRFEFFVYDPVEDGLQCFVYWGPIECRCVVPAHGLSPMPFLGRTWQKPDDHEDYLTAVYGKTWRVPNPYYNFLDDEQDIRERSPWHGTKEWLPGVDGAP